MPKFEDGSYSSIKGLSLISKVLAGRCQMRYTKAAVGKGYIPEGESPGTMTAPAGYVMDAQIASVSNPACGECQVTVQVNSNDVQTGFFATCIILYADDPDEGEIPFTYLVLENGPEWIRPQSSDVGKIVSFDIIAAVGDVEHVTAEIDPDSIVTRQAVQEIADKLAETATTTSNGMMSDADKTKLNGIAAGANKYTHPTTSGNKHIPSGGSSGQILRWSADGTAVWGTDNNTTYSNFVKSGSGAKAGLVPAPSTTAGTTKYLREDGTWTVPPNFCTKESIRLNYKG